MLEAGNLVVWVSNNKFSNRVHCTYMLWFLEASFDIVIIYTYKTNMQIHLPVSALHKRAE